MKHFILILIWLFTITAATAQYMQDKYFDPAVVEYVYSDIKVQKQIPASDGYDKIIPFKRGHFWVYKEGKIGLVDRSGFVVIEPIYSSIEPYKGKYAWIHKDGKVGLIELYNGFVVFQPEWERIEEFKKGKAKAFKDNKEYIIDIQGNVIIQ